MIFETICDSYIHGNKVKRPIYLYSQITIDQSHLNECMVYYNGICDFNLLRKWTDPTIFKW